MTPGTHIIVQSRPRLIPFELFKVGPPRPATRSSCSALCCRGLGLQWVKSVGSTRRTSSQHVRCAVNSDRIVTRGSPSLGANSGREQVQQNPLLDHLVGTGEKRQWELED